MKITVETKGGFDNIEKWLKGVTSRDPSKGIGSIASEATRSLVANTPRNTGETANGWVEKVTKKGDVTEVAWINNAHPGTAVNIAKLLDIGYSTGTGGYVPPRPYIKNTMRPIWDRVDRYISKELIK